MSNNKTNILIILFIMLTLGSVSYLYYREFTNTDDDQLRLLYLEGTLQDSLVVNNNNFDDVVTVDHVFEKLRNGNHYFLVTFVNFPDSAHVSFRVTNQDGDIVSVDKVQSISSNKATKVNFVVKSVDEQYNLQYNNVGPDELDLVRIELSL